MTTGEFIREKRKEKKMTQEELAHRIGVKHSVISKYENGLIEPSIEVLNKIADALIIPRNEFLLYIFGFELDRILEKDPDLKERFYNPPPDYGIDIAGVIKQIRGSIKEGDTKTARNLQELLKKAVPNTHLSIYNEIQEALEKERESKLLTAFHDLNDEGQAIAVDVIEGLARLDQYQYEYGRIIPDVEKLKNPFSQN